MAVQLDSELLELESMTKPDLERRWSRLTGLVVPKVSERMLRLALAYELQAKARGGLPRKSGQRLDQAAKAKTRTSDIQPGMRLIRSFGGTVHQVVVGDKGQIVWNDREWSSLSEVARAITGTRWSGPAFFGLRKAVRKRGAAA